MTTVAADRQACARTTSSKGPTGAPGSHSSASSDRRIPAASTTCSHHSPVVTSSSPVVDALVRSVASTPVSQWTRRSGSSSIRSAHSYTVVPREAISWYTVVNGRCCSPFLRYSSAAGIARHIVREIGHALLLRGPDRGALAPSATRALAFTVDVPTSMVTSGCATRLRNHCGSRGCPPAEAKMA